MREIKFKGKRADNGDWVIGSLVMVCDGESLRRYPCIVISFNHDVFDWHEVIPDTVGQFTGLTDKNGKEIFEGDIVRWCLGKHYWEAVIATVPNNKSNTLYAMETFHNCTTDLTNECYTYERSNSRNGIRNDIEYLSERVEIIGNIHETPELLK